MRALPTRPPLPCLIAHVASHSSSRSLPFTHRVFSRKTQTGENFALRISVDYHKLTVIATDGVDTEPFETDVVIVHLGERYDVLVTADRLVGNGNFYTSVRKALRVIWTRML